jgi:hypothetical protein
VKRANLASAMGDFALPVAEALADMQSSRTQS